MDEIWSEQQYRQWLLTLTNDEYEIRAGEHQIDYLAGEYTGSAVFHPQNIIELMINNSKEESSFYLHFQLSSRDHAVELAEQMLQTLITVKNRKSINVVLTCSSALTTTFFAMKLNEAADVLGVDMHFKAVSIDKLYTEGMKYDVILLAPQVVFNYEKIKGIMKNQIVLRIPVSVFAQYASGKIIDMVQQAIKEKEQVVEPYDDMLPIRKLSNNKYRILTLALINHKDGARFAYRIFDHGRMTLDKEVIKPSISPEDIDDLMDYITTRHKNIDVVGIATPGIAFEGNVTLETYGFHHMNLAQHIFVKYGLFTVVINDVNAMTLGYYGTHENCDNLTFFFQPRGLSASGVGMMIDGKLHLGHGHNAGEAVTFMRRCMPDADELIRTPEGAMELVTRVLHMCICMYAPDKIAVYSELTPDMKEIRTYLSQYIDENLIPELVPAVKLKKYMLLGAMMRCLDILNDEPRMKVIRESLGKMRENAHFPE